MGVLANQKNSVNELFNVVATRNDVALSVSSLLRATRYLSSGDYNQFISDMNQMTNSTEDIEQATVTIFNTDETCIRTILVQHDSL